MTTPKSIDSKQKKVIWSIAKKELGIESDVLYSLIMEMTGAERMSALSWNEAELVIKELRRKAYGLGLEKLTPLQYRGILYRASAFCWSKEGLRRFIKNETGVMDINWLSVTQARIVITGMEKIKKWREKNPKADSVDGIQ